MQNHAICAALLVLTACGTQSSQGSPLPPANPNFDHSYSSYDAMLNKYVSNGVVDYTAIAKTGELDGILSTFVQAGDPSAWTKDEQLAYWINAYNVYTIDLIVDNMPVASIKDINWPLGPWKQAFIPLQGGTITLDQIEHGTIRANFAEPRIHFALVCASKGCPPLRSSAFVADQLNMQLDEQAAAFLNDTKRNRVDAKGIHLSKLLSWYGGDFDSVGGVRTFVGKHIENVADQPIDYLDYDWTLNGH